MNLQKLFRLWPVLLIAGAGILLITRPGSLTPESVVRQEAVRLMAPAGIPVANANTTIATDPVSPSPINVADIAPGQYDPDNQYDRWVRGEIDLDEEASFFTEAEWAAAMAEAAGLEADPEVDIAQTEGRAPSAGVAFDSIDIVDCCGSGANVPPDPELAVGSNHVIAVVNVAFEIYDKTGTSVIGPLTFSSFFTGVSGCSGPFDPNALYDEEAGRYILGVDAGGANYCIAVSATSDPTGVWYRYAFAAATPSANFFDYPHAGVGDNALYMGGNMYNCVSTTCSFIESRIWAYDKAAMYSGSSASFVTASIGTSGFTPQPLNLHGFDQGTWPSTNTHLFMAGLNADNVRLFSWTNALTGGSPGLVTTYNLQTITGVSSSEPLSFPQSGTGGDLRGNDYLIYKKIQLKSIVLIKK